METSLLLPGINQIRFSRWLSGKESTCNAGATRCGFDPRVRKIPWKKKCNPLQYSCLENPMDRGAWWATVHGVTRVGYDLASKSPSYIVTCHLQIVTVLDAFPVWMPFLLFLVWLLWPGLRVVSFLKDVYFWLCWGFVAVHRFLLAVASTGCPVRCTGFSSQWCLLL